MITLLLQRAVQVAQLGSVVLDASIREQHGMRVDVTSNPVERGSPISDHRRLQPRSLTVEGVITNAPSGGQEIDPGRAAAAYEALKDLARSSELVTVITNLETYENMTLTDLAVPKDAPRDDLRFTATFTEIRIVENAQVLVKNSRVDRGKPKVDQHKKTADTAKSQEEEGTAAWYLNQYVFGSSPAQKADVLSKMSKGVGLGGLLGGG